MHTQGPPQPAWDKQRAAQARWEPSEDAAFRFSKHFQRREERINQAAEKVMLAPPCRFFAVSTRTLRLNFGANASLELWRERFA